MVADGLSRRPATLDEIEQENEQDLDEFIDSELGWIQVTPLRLASCRLSHAEQVWVRNVTFSELSDGESAGGEFEVVKSLGMELANHDLVKNGSSNLTCQRERRH